MDYQGKAWRLAKERPNLDISERKHSSRGKKKQAALLDKAAKLFARNGYRSCSVQDVTRHLGISKGGFYWYFESKEELFRKICQQQCQDHRELFANILGGAPKTQGQLVHASAVFMEELLSKEDSVRLIIDFLHESHLPGVREELRKVDEEWAAVLSGHLESLRQNKVLDSRLDPHVLVRQILIFFHGLLFHFYAYRDKQDVLREWHVFVSALMESSKEPPC